MQKMPTIFMRDEVSRGKALARDEINPLAQWVFDGEGIAYIKWDGTCCAVMDGKFYRRLNLKQGKPKPEGWVHWSGEGDSGHGWPPVTDHPQDAMHRDAWDLGGGEFPDGTYELIGPRIQRNPHGVSKNLLIPHVSPSYERGIPVVSFDAIRNLLAEEIEEGFVWHHPDGRMAKIKRRDFGLPWPVK